MINKLILSSVIKKYYLGEIEQVKWSIKNESLEINFISPTKILIGKVKCKTFPIEDIDLAIYNTKKLDNLINITHGDLMLDVTKQNKLPLKLNISDQNYNLSYALSDPLLIPKVGKVKKQDENDIKIELDSENVSHLLKAKNALAEVDNMLITTLKDLDGQLICEFIFGDEQGHNNKVTYQIAGEINKNNIKLKYNSNFFKTILNANKDMEGGELEVSSEGLLRIYFSNGEIESEYFMVPQEDGIY
tara:strand:- start:469 stop:1206 length:738 start_codon:yes stop_codon:yes gene_type:complete